MSHIIHFRSHQKNHSTRGESLKKIRGRGTEYDSLRLATSYDDARDIAWRQSAKGENLYIKAREDTAKISIRVIGVRDQSWDFSMESGDYKDDFYQRFDHICAESSKHYGYPYKSTVYTHMSIDDLSSHMMKDQIRDELVIIIASNQEKESYTALSKIAKHNDIIIIDLLHPYESNPDLYKDTLVESSLIDTKKYKIDLESRKEDISRYLSTSQISYIRGLSSDHPADLLNHFFKYRYVR